MIDLKPACDRMIDVLRGVTDDRLDDPTPCTEYTVGDLVDHIDMVSRGFAAMAGRDRAADSAEADAQGARHRRDDVAVQVKALGAAWDDPAAWSGSTDAGGLELPNEQWGKIALTEMVVHGWDLATATGQAFDLPDDALRACHDHVSVFVPAAPVPSLWGAPATVPPDAPLLDRILAVTGRTP